jgi:hypothetical protein
LDEPVDKECLTEEGEYKKANRTSYWSSQPVYYDTFIYKIVCATIRNKAALQNGPCSYARVGP